MNNKILIWVIVVIIIIVGIFIAVQKSSAPESASLQQQQATTTDEMSGESMTASSTDTTSATSTGDAMTKSTQSVTISNFAFSPKTITIKKGTTVTWTNQDSVRHTVTGVKGGPSSQLFGKGETYSYTFTDAGTFDYYCKPHPYMKGTIIVTE